MLVACLVSAASDKATAQSFGRTPVIDDGKWARNNNGFALICRSLGMNFESELSAWKRKPADQRILVVFGRNASRRFPVDINQFVAAGGAALVAADRGAAMYRSTVFVSGPLRTFTAANQFQGYDDCLIVSRFGAHPVLKGLTRIATNRPGGIRLRDDDWMPLAQLPERVVGITKPHHFLVAPNDNRRILLCSDPSVFSNQMLVQLDNARFALQALNWLQDGKRKSVLFLVDGKISNPEDPRSVDVDFPPPTRDQVLSAIRNLPPDLMMQVGNEVATIVEDENLVNEVMGMAMEEVSAQQMTRALIFLLTILLAGFLFFRYIRSENTLQEAAGTDTRQLGPSTGWLARRRQAIGERHEVARKLVGRFYARVSDGRHSSYVGFPAELQFVDCEQEKLMRKEMKTVASRLRWKYRKWWTQHRLRALQAQVDYWEHLFDKKQLIYQPTHFASLTDDSLPSNLQTS